MKYSKEIEHLLSHIGSELKRKREQLGLSQEELAERSGLHRTYITDIEQGKRNITLKSLFQLTKALQIPLGELFSSIQKKIDPTL
jgi:transcriptional regulator with XRE-family HTH domain